MNKWKKLYDPLVIMVIVLVMLLLFGISYRYDNKYTHPSPQAIGGVLFLDRQELENSPYLFLVNGWEYFDNLLLTPAKARVLQPTETIAIGQYPGMEAAHPDASPHGSATYRMTLVLPEEPAQYSLGLPEIFSAYHLYVNDRLLVSRGNPNPSHYKAAVQSGVLTFEAGGKTELLIAVSDYSHFYSGMVYPPAFGLPDAISTIMGSRMIFCGLICCIAVCFTIFYFCVSIGYPRDRHSNLLYAAICLCSAYTLGYPIFHRMFVTGIQPWYTLEFFCRYAIFALLCMLVNDLCGVNKKIRYLSNMMDFLMCIVIISISLFAPYMSAASMKLFSHAAEAYKWICALYILFIAGIAVFGKKSYSKAILYGAAAFATALPAERFFPMFEPIRFGWFTELSMILLVMILGVILWINIIQNYQKNTVLQIEAQQMNLQIAMQKEHYDSFAGQLEDLRRFRHDQHHHLNVISAMLIDRKYDELSDYVEKQRLDSALISTISFCPIYSLDVLLRHYYSLANEQMIRVEFRIMLPDTIHVSSSDLCVVFGNLLENAVEACRNVPPVKKSILLCVSITKSIMKLEMTNSYNGLPLTPDGDLYFSTKERGRKGIGLRSVAAIAAKYNGGLAVTARPNGIDSIFLTQLFFGDA